MLTYIAICLVQFFIITSLMTGSLRKIYSRYYLPYEGMWRECWILSVFCSLIPFFGLAGIFLVLVMFGDLAFSTKWKAD